MTPLSTIIVNRKEFTNREQTEESRYQIHLDSTFTIEEIVEYLEGEIRGKWPYMILETAITKYDNGDRMIELESFQVLAGQNIRIVDELSVKNGQFRQDKFNTC